MNPLPDPLVLDGSTMMAVFGRLHPMVLHLPIGLLAGLAALEGLAVLRRSPASPPAPGILAVLAAASAVASAATGYALSLEGSNPGTTLDLHLRFGIAVAVGTVALAIARLRCREGSRRGLLLAYRALLIVTLGLLGVAGHLGASMTHGEDFLIAPLRGPAAPSAADAKAEAPSRSSYAAVVAPIFHERCRSCHGEARQKEGLALHTPQGIKSGSKHGPVVVAGKPEDSLLVQRLRLPLDEKGHMPPAQKPQPTAAEIRVIEQWIAAGAPFDGVVPGLEPAARAAPVTGSGGAPGEKEPAPARPEALAGLRAQLVHVQPLAQDSNLLWVDFSAPAAEIGDGEARALLEPVHAQVAHLSLARAKVTDAILPFLAGLERLERLDLRATAVTDAGLAALRSHPRLEVLVLVQTRLGDAAIAHLETMPALKRVYVWGAGLSADAVARLRAERPALAVDAGKPPEAAAAEVEGPIKLSSDAGPPGVAPAAGVPPSGFAPINPQCPVSGQPVNPAYIIVFEGRVIGFCCPKCPAQFWAEPEKFRSKLP